MAVDLEFEEYFEAIADNFGRSSNLYTLTDTQDNPFVQCVSPILIIFFLDVDNKNRNRLLVINFTYRSQASAITNAVYHATGKRVRDLPITLDKLL